MIAVNAMLVPGLKGDTYATLSYEAERLEGYAKHILDYYNVSRKDILIIISNSGRNAVPIEMAMEAKKKGIKVVAITSLDYSKRVPSRHSSGKKLYEIADIVIDNCCPLGEGLVNVEGVPFKVGPSSTVTGTAIINAIMVQAAQNMVEKGVEPPVCKNRKVKIWRKMENDTDSNDLVSTVVRMVLHGYPDISILFLPSTFSWNRRRTNSWST